MKKQPILPSLQRYYLTRQRKAIVVIRVASDLANEASSLKSATERVSVVSDWASKISSIIDNVYVEFI